MTWFGEDEKGKGARPGCDVHCVLFSLIQCPRSQQTSMKGPLECSETRCTTRSSLSHPSALSAYFGVPRLRTGVHGKFSLCVLALSHSEAASPQAVGTGRSPHHPSSKQSSFVSSFLSSGCALLPLNHQLTSSNFFQLSPPASSSMLLFAALSFTSLLLASASAFPTDLFSRSFPNSKNGSEFVFGEGPGIFKAGFDKLVAFGDSLTDDGNAFKLTNGVLPPAEVTFYFFSYFRALI